MVINSEELFKNCANNERIVRRLLEIFLQQAPIWVTDLQNAFAAADIEEVRALCHRIKGGAGTVQAAQVSEAAVAVGNLVKSDGLEKGETLLPNLMSHIDKALADAGQFLETLPPAEDQ